MPKVPIVRLGGGSSEGDPQPIAPGNRVKREADVRQSRHRYIIISGLFCLFIYSRLLLRKVHNYNLISNVFTGYIRV